MYIYTTCFWTGPTTTSSAILLVPFTKCVTIIFYYHISCYFMLCICICICKFEFEFGNKIQNSIHSYLGCSQCAGWMGMCALGCYKDLTWSILYASSCWPLPARQPMYPTVPGLWGGEGVWPQRLDPEWSEVDIIDGHVHGRAVCLQAFSE